MKIAKINIEGYIGEIDKDSPFDGEKNFTLSNLKTFLAGLSPDVTDIHYKVNSGGGSVYDGWDIHNELKSSGKKLTAIGEGIVGSIATIIFMSAKPENRKLIKGTKFFVHHPYWLPDESQPMRANELLSLGKDLKVEQDKILNFYAKETKTSASDLHPFLEKETDLTAENAVKMGFANEIIEEETEVEYHQYRLVAMITPNKTNPNIMSKETENVIVSKMNAFEKLLNKLFKGKVLNMNLSATNSNGETVNLFIESETEDLTGKDVFIVDAEGNQTPAPDGDYTDADGKTIKVSGGKVAEVVAVATESDEVQALKAEIETLKAENKTAKDELQAKVAEIDEVKANVKEINTQFEALRKTVIGEGAKFETGTQDFKNKKTTTGNSYLDELAARQKKN